MIVKFHMWHDQTSRLQNEKIQPSRIRKASNVKNSTTNEIDFSANTAGCIRDSSYEGQSLFLWRHMEIILDYP